MAFADLPNTGVELIDSLQVVQMGADLLLDDPDKKSVHFAQQIRDLRAGELLGHTMFIGADVVYAQHPDQNPDDRFVFQSGMMFTATLDEFRYTYSPHIPLDALMLGFEQPEVFDAVAEPEHSASFRRLYLQVPILALQSCIDLAS